MAQSQTDAIEIKLIVVGDGGIGKTSLLLSYARNIFPSKYEPTVFDCITTDVSRHNCNVKLNLWDTAGQEDYDRLRPLAYHRADIFLLCFALDSTDSVFNAKAKWAKELEGYSEAPILLVGLKSDLRKEPGVKCISKREGSDAASTIKAVQYFECSALTKEGVDAVFDFAVDEVICPKRSKLCRIL